MHGVPHCLQEGKVLSSHAVAARSWQLLHGGTSPSPLQLRGTQPCGCLVQCWAFHQLSRPVSSSAQSIHSPLLHQVLAMPQPLMFPSLPSLMGTGAVLIGLFSSMLSPCNPSPASSMHSCILLVSSVAASAFQTGCSGAAPRAALGAQKVSNPLQRWQQQSCLLKTSCKGGMPSVQLCMHCCRAGAWLGAIVSMPSPVPAAGHRRMWHLVALGYNYSSDQSQARAAPEELGTDTRGSPRAAPIPHRVLPLV